MYFFFSKIKRIICIFKFYANGCYYWGTGGVRNAEDC